MREMNPNVNLSPAHRGGDRAAAWRRIPTSASARWTRCSRRSSASAARALTATVSGVGHRRVPLAARLGQRAAGHAATAPASGPSPSTCRRSGSDPGASRRRSRSRATRPPPVAPLVSQPAEQARAPRGCSSRAVVGALAIAGHRRLVALRPDAGPSLRRAAAADAPTPMATAPATAARRPSRRRRRPAQPTFVKVRVNSDPDGASVKEDGVELCSSTPCDILYKGADADPAKDHKLTLARNGLQARRRAP